MGKHTQQLITKVLVSDFDASIVNDLIYHYVKIDDFEREIVREEVYILKCNLKILSFSELLAEKAYNEKDEEFLINALLLHSIENFRWDPRENFIYLSIIWYVAQSLKIDTDLLFENVIKISSKEAGSFLHEFIRRPKALKSLKAMGLKALIIDSKISFEIIKPPWCKT